MMRRANVVDAARVFCLSAMALGTSACPAPPIDFYYPYDASPFDAQPSETPLRNPSGPPSCAPESVLDLNARGTRNGRTITFTVDTRNARNDLRPTCVFEDGPEVVLRYAVPPVSQSHVAAVRISTVTDTTRAVISASAPANPIPIDPTTFDSVLFVRTACDGRDLSCDNDDVLPNAFGNDTETRKSTVWLVDVQPEDLYLIAVDGNEGSAGVAQVTLEEYPQLGVVGAPCIPIPPRLALDPTAPTAPFRCPVPGARCQPGAAADGTDLCLPIVPLGAPCDEQQRFGICDRWTEGSVCASNPSDEHDVKCALPGTAAGAPCRAANQTGPRCDAGLFCSVPRPGEGIDTCVPIRAAGESCDPTPIGPINHCADGLSCCVFGDAGDETTCQPSGPGCVTPAAQ